MKTLVDGALDFWLASRRFNDRFETHLAKYRLSSSTGDTSFEGMIATIKRHWRIERNCR